MLCCAVSFNYEQEKDLCSGPSKLCESLYISKEEINEADLTESSMIWLEGRRDFLKMILMINKEALIICLFEISKSYIRQLKFSQYKNGQTV